jgi:hypothetical protein
MSCPGDSGWRGERTQTGDDPNSKSKKQDVVRVNKVSSCVSGAIAIMPSSGAGCHDRLDSDRPTATV